MLMKKVLWLSLLLTFFTYKSQVKDNLNTPKKPKIGLVLAGGGAKGFAHVGVLKVLDSLGVKVDYISGTSMGAIVGGLYASGYTGNDIEKIITNTDFYDIIANEKNRKETSFFSKATDKYLLNIPIKNGKINVLPKAISTGQKNIYMLKDLFKNVSNVENFSQLPIPFMCVTTNLESGKMKIFEKGDLIKAIMASSAYPSLMDPVKIGDSLYIDGAMTINYPAQPLKEKGMDIIIGVDLSQGLAKREDLQSAISILNQVIDFGIQNETKNQYQYIDINIHPKLDGMNATSYGDKEKILKLGYEEAQKYIDILSKLPKRKHTQLRVVSNPVYSNIYKIDSLEVKNNKIFSRSYLQGKMNLKTPSPQTYGSINKMVDKLYATNNYNLINYDIIQSNGKNILQVTVDEDQSRYYLKFGLHYDELFKTGLLINATARRLLLPNSTVSLDVVVGDSPRYYFNYFMDNGYIPGLGVSSSGMKLNLKNNKGTITEDWTWLRNEVFIHSIWRDRYAIGGGLSHDYFKTSNLNINEVKNFINPYFFIKSDTQDDKNFPTRGFFLDAEAKILELFNEKNSEITPIQVKADLRMNFPISSWLTYNLSLFGGFTTNYDNLSHFYQYRIGGFFGQKLGNFAQMQGYYFGYTSSPNLLTATNNFQFKIHKNYFIIAHFGMANLFNEINLKDMLNINHKGLGITAGYKSPFGQIKINYSNPLNKNKGMFNVVLGHWF
ncbi:patatin [Riemerella anatipestifer]|uniref:Patatin n=1 Tax=Riemerella anatipestifer (strain ATCC 11845 / DSM 15868 / JCM 9532 / NCTC 11014) TaxID=693978 RepID=E4TAA5_RIEAD|nr:patatin-like phospholipase family protein [Riemerella anatipestifer]ADQ82265.1 Patatin [Riemerella anatipestifer ATCC 11845 = DSM 15868]ADZ12238.1 Predicted esterase of the alpha-beta hydrolase superfamily [Riemerella anatipestifer RA-GD]AFD56269.1 patatin [Riemerella anatipestifer ATCC 11845 = DSM 15868]MCE4247387.1 patatin-like phospholipase family protein [Riemerella anatipestifer]MCU7580449.1 patatin-like phospholipase family protein [Riemerella anatipestifer]